MIDVTALGELLIDFTPCGKSASDMRIFEQNPGGAPANVLCALANLGLKTEFIGKVGKDMHGEFLKDTLTQKDVGTIGLIEDPSVFTTLAFVSLSEDGNRSFSFARKPGADTCLSSSELNKALLQNTKIFHFGSLSLTDEPVRTATYDAVRIAKESGALISYDPNYRALLWDTKEHAIEMMRSMLDFVDVMKISDEETNLLTSHSDPVLASQELIDRGIPCVVVTLGKDGALLRTKNILVKASVKPCKAVDTTGAGDSFWGGFLFKLLKSRKKLADITQEDATEFLTFANAVATLCVQKRGAIPAMPTLDQVNQIL